MKSFSPEKAQTELAWNLDARLKFVAGSPPVGGAFPSPAKAALEPRPMNNAAETAAAEREHFIFSSFGCEPKRARANLPALLQTGQVRSSAETAVAVTCVVAAASQVPGRICAIALTRAKIA